MDYLKYVYITAIVFVTLMALGYIKRAVMPNLEIVTGTGV